MLKEKISNLLLFILIFFSILSIIILNPVSDLDEIWNYNFARNIANGLIPYKDFNMIITPLMSVICGLILKITVDELIIMRILAAILCSTIIYITYKLFNLLEVKRSVTIIFTFFIGYLFKNIFCIDYNYGSLLIGLIIIYQEIKLYKKEKNIISVNLKNDILLGILAGLSITIKQTTGIFICLALLGNKLIFVKNKEEIKIYLKSLFYRVIGIIIPVLIMVIYLIINSAFTDFINYTIQGITEFTNSISYKSLVNWNLLGVLSILVPLGIVYGWIKSVIYEKEKDIYFLTIYGLAMFVICFPISNEIHFLIGALPIIILILYELYNLIKIIKIKMSKKEIVIDFILLTFKYIIILFLIYKTILNFHNYYNNRNSYCELEHFRYISIDKTLEKQIIRVDKYILANKDVKILETSAAVYMIPINRYNKDYDMFNIGNFGKNGEERLMKEIHNSSNTIYLILNDKFNKNWQTPVDIIEYVKQNRIKIGQIEIFDIYE